MKKLILILLLGGFALTSCQKEDLSSVTELEAVEGRGKEKREENKKADASMTWGDCDAISGDYAELYAGQHELVGRVTVKEEGDFYVIRYEMDAGFCLKETHLEVVGDPGDFPMSGGGNPPPGQFTYKGYHDCETDIEYKVPLTDFEGPIYIAAHAVVNCQEKFVPGLPDVTTFCTKFQGTDATQGAYFDVELPDLYGDNLFGAWCVDVDLGIGIECIQGAKVYSSLDFPPSLFENPKNMPAVNWLLNHQDLIGTVNEDSDCPDGAYNFGDFQNAIWLLIDDEGTRTGENLGDWDDTLCRANELKEMAIKAVINGYTTECGDYVGVIFVPVDEQHKPNKQAVIIPFPLECQQGCSETAWARNSKEVGCDFPGGNWATYFKFGESIPE
jgi:hypothetical protein